MHFVNFRFGEVPGLRTTPSLSVELRDCIVQGYYAEYQEHDFDDIMKNFSGVSLRESREIIQTGGIGLGDQEVSLFDNMYSFDVDAPGQFKATSSFISGRMFNNLRRAENGENVIKVR